MSEDTKVYNCSGCGGEMEFDVKSQSLKCPNCGIEIELSETRAIKEYDFAAAKKSSGVESWGLAAEMIKCESCGGETIVEKTITAVKCGFCGSTHVLESKQTFGIAPEAILPFKTDSNKANETFAKWLKGRWLAPEALKHLHERGMMHGLYVPYWTYDADTNASYRGEGGKVYYVTVGSGDKKRREPRVKWYPVAGRVGKFFDDVCVIASSNSNAQLISAVEPFNTAELKPFASEYIAGFSAEHYVVQPQAGFETAKSKMKNELEQMARAQILTRYDQVRLLRLNVNYQDVRFKHVLLPVWVANYSFNGKSYNYIINAQTNRVSGEYPKSTVKIVLIVVLAVIVIGIVLFFANYNTQEAALLVAGIVI